MPRSLLLVCVALLSTCGLVAGCGGTADAPPASGGRATGRAAAAGQPALVQLEALDATFESAAEPTRLVVAAAQNETVGLQMAVRPRVGSTVPLIEAAGSARVRLEPLRRLEGDAVIPASGLKLYQVVDMPVDVNRAGYLRQTGQEAGERLLPRALVPLDRLGGRMRPMNRPAGFEDSRAQHVSAEEPERLLIWLDVTVPPTAEPGRYLGKVLLETEAGLPLAEIPLVLQVRDFVLPARRSVTMSGDVPWQRLEALWPERFEGITPRLMNRREDAYRAAVETLDDLMSLADAHRVQLTFDALQPTVKWPAGQPPQIDWSDYRDVVAPWLSGTGMAGGLPVQYWPLPQIRFLENYPQSARLEYVRAAAAWFDQQDWLSVAPLRIQQSETGRATLATRLELSALAGTFLTAYGRLDVMLPLEGDQLAFSNDTNPRLLPRNLTDRLYVASPGLVGVTGADRWPSDLPRPRRWLRLDRPSDMPAFGLGGEATDVRTWAWLAFLRGADLITLPNPLPAVDNRHKLADPQELVWFYPGKWFGLEEPVPSVQLKWLRRAQQDFEYLNLARQRGEVINARLMSRLMTKPVEILPTQSADPAYVLLSGTTDLARWEGAMELLTRTILLREPGVQVSDGQRTRLNLETLQWMEPQERSLLVAREAAWSLSPRDDRPGDYWLHCRLGIDIYNASDERPDQNTLRWTDVPEAWQIEPRPIVIPSLATYQVRRVITHARVDLSRLKRPVSGYVPPVAEVTFLRGFNNQATPLQMALPVSLSERRLRPLEIDGSLEDWSGEDALIEGPLVKMLERPAVQQQELPRATTTSAVYSGWSDSHFYVGFRVEGLSEQSIHSTKNFVTYDLGRAWGEDLVQMVVQALYADGSQGPLLHVVCKPNGHWVERKVDDPMQVSAWQPFQAGIRYAGTVHESTWRGEVAVPFSTLTRGSDMPVALKFNFVQHKEATGESASWAGPLDAGRDEPITGAIILRDTDQLGM